MPRHGSGYYLDHFIRMRCGADMIAQGLFPNAKEVTESFGAFESVAQNLQFDFGDENVSIVVVGDGGTPRTAATFAYRTKWKCWSIDPEMRDRPYESKIDRLRVLKSKIQDIPILDFGKSPVVIVHMHAHVKIDESIKRIKGSNVSVTACPCCVPQFISGTPHHIEYRDQHIHSPHNLIKIWKHLCLNT